MGLNRLNYLDSARGIASIIVLFSHFFGAFVLPSFFSSLNNTFLHVFWDGKIAVSFFFVLSGFVLSRIYFINSSLFTEFNYLSYLLKRIFRIYPVFIFVLIISFFSVNYLYNEDIIRNLSISTPWIKYFWNEKYSIFSTIKESILVIRLPQEPEKRLINQDWTLSIEVLVSLLVPVFITIVKKNKIWLVITALLLLRLHTVNWIIEFIVGVYIASSFDDIKQRINSKVSIFLFIILFVLISIRYLFSFSDFLDLIIIKILSILLLLLILFSKGLQKFLSNNIIVFLGKISYSLYLIHFLVILIFAPKLFQVLLNFGYFNGTIIFILVLFSILLLSIIFAFLLNKFIEKPAYKISTKFISFCKNVNI